MGRKPSGPKRPSHSIFRELMQGYKGNADGGGRGGLCLFQIIHPGPILAPQFHIIESTWAILCGSWSS
ncbi:unnamed protein product [Dovyalis caffra]|uniref:Uncharacterized protein n=1 Tax=Dovyalis caffra TaxID=77055 RepID=A0AAV1S1U4_9ROSI|nr:unnamed protein product [Dovyalis caffra]